MKPINKIMVAVDFSDFSLAAVQYAGTLAQQVGAALLLTHVYNKRDVDMLHTVATRVPEFSAKEYVAEHMKEKKDQLRDLAKELGLTKLSLEMNVCIGVPYDALLKDIKEKKPDLLVMGAKGRSNLADMIIGSCAQKMFRHCPVPLLSVRKR